MERELAELYNKLANQIADMIPVEWDDVNYLGEVEKGGRSWSSTFYFRDVEKDEKICSGRIPITYKVSERIYLDLLLELNKILMEIYACFVKNGQEPWEQLSLYFSGDGKFEIEFFYDVMNEKDGGQISREVIWAYNTFGYIPGDDTFEKILLDRYLKKQ